MLTNSKWQKIQKWLNFSILNSLSPRERVRERARHQTGKSIPRVKPTLRLPPFLASLPLGVSLSTHPLSPWERARERAKHEPESQFRGQSPCYGSCHKTRFACFSDDLPRRKRKLKRSSVGYAHDSTTSNTKRSSKRAVSMKLKRIQRVSLKTNTDFRRPLEQNRRHSLRYN